MEPVYSLNMNFRVMTTTPDYFGKEMDVNLLPTLLIFLIYECVFLCPPLGWENEEEW